MGDFIYQNPVRIYFGEGQLPFLGEELGKYGKRVLMTYGGGSIKKIGLYDRIVGQLEEAGFELFELSGIEPNPRITSVREGAELCKREKIDVLLAVGGGSTIDATKFIGAAAFYDGDPWDLVTRKAPIVDCLPVVTVLTLAAAGSEMNAAGAISNPETREKIGCYDPLLFPKASFLDPALTCTVSPYQTACGTVDMISHIMEIYFSAEKDLEMLDTVMEGFIRTAIQFGPVAMKDGRDYDARANLMYVSTWAQNYFINGAKQPTWPLHVIEHELSAFYDLTHGHGLAILIPRWLDYILDERTAPRIQKLGCNVFGIDRDLSAMDAAKETSRKLADFFFTTLGLKSTLAEVDIDDANIPLMAQKATGGEEMPGFRALNTSDVEAIYRMCL